MRIVTLTQADLINAGCNSLKVLGFAATGCLITVAVDKIAHKVFDIKEYESKGSYVIKGVAVLCGIAPTLYFGGQVTLVTFTARKTFELFLLYIPIYCIQTIAEKYTLREVSTLCDVFRQSLDFTTSALFIPPTPLLKCIIVTKCARTAVAFNSSSRWVNFSGK